MKTSLKVSTLDDFLFHKFVERMLGPFEQVCDFVESLGKKKKKTRKLFECKWNQN